VFATKQDFARSATKKDLENLTVRLVSTMAYKQDVVAIREDVNGLKEIVQGLVVAVDGLTKMTSDALIEYSAMGMQLSRHEKWHRQTASVLDMHLEE